MIYTRVVLFFCLLSIFSNWERKYNYLNSKHSSPAYFWIKHIPLDSLKTPVFGSSDVQTGEILACLCLFCCRLSWHELIPNFEDQFLLITLLSPETGARSANLICRQITSSFHMSAAKWVFHQHGAHVYQTKESKTGALRSSSTWETVITNSHLENYLFLPVLLLDSIFSSW